MLRARKRKGFGFSIYSRPRKESTADSTEQMRALRERERRGPRRFTIGVSEDDLGVIAEHGYEGAARRQPQTSRRKPSTSSSSPTCSPPRSGKGNGTTTAATRYSNVSPPMQRPFQSPENSLGAVPPLVAGRGAGA
jgi:hypothetical protein